MKRTILRSRGFYGTMVKWEMDCHHVILVPQGEITRWSAAQRDGLAMPCSACRLYEVPAHQWVGVVVPH